MTTTITKLTRQGERTFQVNIQIHPKPKNCFECPFYYLPRKENLDEYEITSECFIADIPDYFGNAIQRPKGCPL